ncbi:ABC transporter permease [Solicola gregarius]|uniref:ABC transporter permease n=1 Tax=Solicola gregarius TaxID=2908642 RepID=A0AA46YK08_9ACTN|nr:ABC transporter permease [Solicola gregarius]UYM04031.1 ABC transporter permease [Solicola gregarius]
MTMAPERADDHPHGPLRPPGEASGLLGVFRRRYLLKLLVQKELKNRYQVSLLGLLWSYIKPGFRFVMYLVVIGVGLKMGREVENFPLHILCGLIIVHMATESMNSGTKSITSNRQLVSKMNVPREMLPMTSLLVSSYHTLPQYVILIIACIFTGWTVSVTGTVAVLLGFAIIWLFGLAYSMIAGALNVVYRDFNNFSQTLSQMVMWFTPMIYAWTHVTELGPAVSVPYQFNPIAMSVMLTQRGFWYETIEDRPPGTLPDDLLLKGGIMLVAMVVLVVIAQRVFARLEGRFAEYM